MAAEFVADITADQGIATDCSAQHDTTYSPMHIIMRYGSNDQCEFYDDSCSDDDILWGVDDFGSPYGCTNHYFPQEEWGYELVDINETIDDLVIEYNDWVKQHDLPSLSADELIAHTITGKLECSKLITTEEQRCYLMKFMKRWEAAVDRIKL